MSSYDSTKIAGRVISGDFSHDGLADIAALYDLGSNQAELQTWISSAANNTLEYKGAWWLSPTNWHDPTTATGKIVAFDADNDGYKDDVAALFYLGSGMSKLYTWTTAGCSPACTSFSYEGDARMGSFPGTYYAAKATNRFVVGDFDHNGTADLAAIYSDTSNAFIHLWTNNGTSLTYSSRWTGDPYWGSTTLGKVVAGDFDDNTGDDLLSFNDLAAPMNFRIHSWWYNTASSEFVQRQNSAGWPGLVNPAASISPISYQDH